MAQAVKRLPTMQETGVRSLGREDPLEKEMATHSSTLACKIPWTEEPGRLQAAAAKSLQSCPTLCDPIDSSPVGSTIPGIFQARVLEWGAIVFSDSWLRHSYCGHCKPEPLPVDWEQELFTTVSNAIGIVQYLSLILIV